MPLLGALQRTHVNFEIVSTEDWLVFQEIFVDRVYEPAVAYWLRNAPSVVSTHLDLGSNRGYFATYLAHRLLEENQWQFQIHGVEALAENVLEAQHRLKRQQVVMLKDRIQYHLGLAGERTGSALFSTDNERRMNKVLKDPAPTQACLASQYLDLDVLVPGRIGILKCDIEGSEEAFLETYHTTLLQRCDCAVFELHHKDVDAERCRAFLKAAGLNLMDTNQQGTVTVEVFAR